MKKQIDALEQKDGLPLYCDYSCKFADFPPVDAIGACRKELALFCKKAKKFNNKNSKCIFLK